MDTPSVDLISMDERVSSPRGIAAKAIATAKAFEITEESHIEGATDVLSILKRAKTRLESARKFFVQPLNDHVKKINGIFKAFVSPIDEADVALRVKVLDWQTAERERRWKQQAAIDARARREQEKREAKAAAQAKPAPPPPPRRIVAPVATSSAGIVGKSATRKVWAFEVEDVAKVPLHYLRVDVVAINEAIRNGIREISGVRIYQKNTLQVR